MLATNGYNTLFSMCTHRIPALHLGFSKKGHKESGQPLTAIKEFAHYLASVQKDLDRMSKKFHTRETGESARLAATGIHEAQQYLEIVKKAIEKTQRALLKKSSKFARKTGTPGTSLGMDEEMRHRTPVETWKGVEIWQGKCEGCHTDARVAFDGTRYLCVDCLRKLKSRSITEQSADTRRNEKSPLPSSTTNGDNRLMNTLKTLRRKR